VALGPEDHGVFRGALGETEELAHALQIGRELRARVWQLLLGAEDDDHGLCSPSA
jgi:hypothetical protein